MTESWHLKLSRAQEHLDELERILKPLRHSHDYDVRETIKKTGRGTLRTCRLFSTLEVPPTAAVVLGDLLYNVRSALDHVAVSRVPRRRKFTASFPIFTVDPESAHPGDEKADAARREAWESATKGMIKPTLAAIRSHQPYNARRPPELDHIEVPLGPEDHTLALLSAFQNADKHRELITVVDALDIRSLAVREATGGKILLDRVPLLPAHQLAGNGAVIYRGPLEVSIRASGGLLAAARVGDGKRPNRRLPDFPRELMETATKVVAELERVA